MANLHRSIALTIAPDDAWAKIADVGAVNQIMPFLGEVTLEGDRRTCAMGADELEETIVTVDPERRRLVYAITSSPFAFTQHSASMQIVATPTGCTLEWDHDFKPDGVAPALEQAVEGAVEALSTTMR